MRSVALAAVAATCALQACAAPIVKPDATLERLFSETGDIRAVDMRGGFRDVLCRMLAAHGQDFPDYRPCAEILRSVPPEPPAHQPVPDIDGPLRAYTVLIVPGLGFDCFSRLIGSPGELIEVLRQQGQDLRIVPVRGLGDTDVNAQIVRDSLLGLDAEARARPVILAGYSKGTTDALVALTRYPEIVPYISAFISISGAVGGSPLAEDASQWTLDLLAQVPGSRCEKSTEQTLDSLSPATRKAWLATHALPESIRYFSLVTWPQPKNVSAILKPSYNTLARQDPANDSQVPVVDQVIPGSQLLGFLDADHWAVAVPVARAHPMLGSTFVNHNDFPRELLFVALLRYIDSELRGIEAVARREGR